MENVMHYLLSSSVRKLVMSSNGEFGFSPVCGTGDAHLTGTYVYGNVTCPSCKAVLKERKLDLLETFIRPDERAAVASALGSFGFMLGEVEEYSECMLILHGRIEGTKVFVRRVAGLTEGEITTRHGLTVKNGDLWVEHFNYGEVTSSQLVRNHERWVQ